MARKFEAFDVGKVDNLVIGAGVILTTFDPTQLRNASFESDDILCATDGGISLSIVPEYIDLADGIDSCPSNTADLKRIRWYNVTITGTAKTIDKRMTSKLIGAASTTTASGVSIIKPKAEVSTSDFSDLWFVCDYASPNWPYVAIKVKNALSTGGFSLQSSDADKASFAFTFTAHYSIADSAAPIEIYMCTG